MSQRNAILLLLCLALLPGPLAAAPAQAVTGGTGAAQPAQPRQTSFLHLPLVQRNPPAHPRAAQLEAVAQRGFERLGQDCGWEAGVWATGIAKMWQRTGAESYWNKLKFWVDGCLAQGAGVAHVNDLPLAYAALIVHARQPQPAYRSLASAAASYLFETAPRTQDGTLIHLAGMVWDDTLVVAIPFLLQMGAYSGEARFVDEAVFQVQRHALHLQDSATSLYHHAWSEPANGYSGPSYWGRGNGWVLWAQAELLAALPATDARHAPLLAAFGRQVQALARLQQPESGMWRTVVTRSDFYAETSATALIAAALLTAAANGQVDSAAAQAAAAAEPAAWRQVAADGLVQGVSGVTGPMDQEAAYNTIPVEDFTLYGQGCLLLLGAAALPAP